MLRKRVIPFVLLDGFSVLKTISFNQRRNLGSPITVMSTYNTRNVDELVLLDIDASKQKRAIDKFTVAEVAASCFMPLAVGGGIRKLDDIADLLKCGADKVVINTIAIEQKAFITKAASLFGSQCIVVSVDVVKLADTYIVFNNARCLPEMSLFDWILEVEALGAGEIVLNNVTFDGTMQGVDTELADKIAKLVTIPVIYVGGVGGLDDIVSLGKTKISGIGASSIFHFKDITPKDCSEALKKAGIPAR
jgi:cyclase